MRRTITHLRTEGDFCFQHDVELKKAHETEEDRMRALEASARHYTELEHERLLMAGIVRTRDPDVLRNLQQLGYNPTTASLLFLTPLVQMAWIDGSVNRAERQRILALAEQHGIKGDTPGYHHLEAWLDRRPRETFLQESWQLVCKLLDELPAHSRSVEKDLIMQECRSVASAAGSMVRKIYVRISGAERRLLQQMEEDLKVQPEGNTHAAHDG